MKHTLLLAVALCGLVLVPTARAQDLYVGSNTPSNTLDLTNGTNTYANIYIGYLSGSDSNTLSVNNAGTLLTSSGFFYVGYSGSGNILTINGGGTVAAALGITIAASNGSSGTLNIGRFGTNDTGGTILAPTIAFGNGTGAINFNQSDAVTITSAISGAGTLNQLGTGTTILTGNNSYTETTTVSAGTMFFSLATALPTNTAAALVVGSGATLAFAAGGTGEFNASQISTLLANLTSATNNNNGLLAQPIKPSSLPPVLTHLTSPLWCWG